MSEEFHLQEYRALKYDVIEENKRKDDAFKFNFVSTAVLMGWVLLNYKSIPKELLLFVVWIPLIVSIRYANFHNRRIRKIESIEHYIANLESKMADVEIGWQNYSKRVNSKRFWIFNIAMAYLLSNLVSFSFGAIFTIYAFGFKMGLFNIIF